MPIINPGLPTERYIPDEPKLPSRRELQDHLTLERGYSFSLQKRIEQIDPDAALGSRVKRISDRARGQLWTCSDGARVPVNEMSDPHLFYALAKARRNEYPDSHARRVGVAALEAEALRRLAGL